MVLIITNVLFKFFGGNFWEWLNLHVKEINQVGGISRVEPLCELTLVVAKNENMDGTL
jgi:hypothetical protein